MKTFSHRARLYATLLLSVSLSIHSQAIAANCPLPNKVAQNEEQAIEITKQAMQSYLLTSLALQCVQFFVTESSQRKGEFEVDAREVHNTKCGGDPATSPRIFSLRIKANGQIKLYDAPSADYIVPRCPAVNAK